MWKEEGFMVMEEHVLFTPKCQGTPIFLTFRGKVSFLSIRLMWSQILPPEQLLITFVPFTYAHSHLIALKMKNSWKVELCELQTNSSQDHHRLTPVIFF